MNFLIVTGLSGAGKSMAVNALEDIGFFCVDNLPPALIPVFYDLCLKTEGTQNRAAVVTDTRGTLLWDKPADGERPLLILTSCQASREYLDYLEGLHISWIACGGDKIDLARACEILKEEFGVQRAAVVGGGHINAAFLADGLLDEVSILVGAGIDGRGGMAAVFDGLPMDRPVTPLKLTSVQQYGTGAVWLRYHTEK